MVWQKPSKIRCEKCGALTLEKGGRLVCTNEACGNVMKKGKEEPEIQVRVLPGQETGGHTDDIRRRAGEMREQDRFLRGKKP